MKKPKEVVDLSTLPKVSIGTSTLILDFKNNERRLKLIEVLFKTPEKIVKIFSRDHIIEYAKENKIYIDPTEGKKPNPKDPPIEKKEITPEELAKAVSGLITDASVQYRKDKKALMDNIEVLKKQKEDAVAYWDNPPPQDPKKKPDKKTPPQPHEIIIPVIDEMELEFLVLLYNYPMNAKEYSALEKENVLLNNIHLCTEVEDSREELKTEGNNPNEKNKKPQPVKESKAPIDNQIIKYFSVPADYDPKGHFAQLQNGRINSDYLSKMRIALFDKDDFSFKILDDSKRTFFNVYQEEYVAKMKEIFRFYLYYLKWLELNKFVNLGTDAQVFSSEHVKELLNACDYEPKDYEHQSIGNILISYFAGFEDKMEEEAKVEFDQHQQQGQQVEQQQEQSEENIDEAADGKDEIAKLFKEFELDIEDEYNPKIQQVEETPENNDENNQQNKKEIVDEKDINKEEDQQDLNINNENKDKDQQEPQQEVKGNENEQKDDEDLQIIEKENIDQHQINNQDISKKQTNQQDENANEASDHTQYSNPDIYLDYERLIINEHDYYMKRSIEAKNEQAYIFQIEKHFNTFRSLPGIARPPTLSPVEEHLRKAKRSKVYPFLSSDISIPVFEKYETIFKFEEIMQLELPDRKFNFGNRIYQETMNKDILSQCISRLMMFDPERKIVYNERNDTMLLIFYYRCSPNRVERKMTQYKYLSKPDFENWVKFFKPVFSSFKMLNAKTAEEVDDDRKEGDQGQDIKDKDNNPNPNPNANLSQNANANINTNIQHQSQSGNLHSQTALEPQATNPVQNTATLNQKKVNSPFALLSNVFDGNMYLANDTYLGNVNEKIKYMFPSDNGIFVKKIIENGIFSSYSSYVLKDDLIFGIRKPNEDQKEFWYHYENNSILTINYYNKEVYANIALPNGLNVQVLPNGQIAQKLIDQEEYRVIASKSTVMKYLPNDEVNVLYASGNYSKIKDNKCINVNNKGLRLERDLVTNKQTELSPIPITIQTDTDSQSKTLIREDGVIHIKYPDETCLTIHSDTTKIFSYNQDSEGNSRYTFEHDSYATVNTFISGKTKTFKGNEVLDELFKLSSDGIVYQINMPDRNEVYVYKQQCDKADDSLTMTITLIVNHDGSLIKIKEDGEIDVISPTERMRLKETNQFNQYVFESLSCAKKDGIYTCSLKEGKIFTIDRENNLFEIYDDGYANCVLCKYEPINYNEEQKEMSNQSQEGGEGLDAKSEKQGDAQGGIIEDNNPKSLQLNDNEIMGNENLQHNEPNPESDIIPLDRPKSPEYTEDMRQNNLDDQNRPIYPPTFNFIAPRLFVIENDSSGYELLTEEQMINFKYLKDNDVRHTKYIKEELTKDFTSHFWISKYFSIKEGIQEIHHINDIQIPSNLEKFTRLPIEAIYQQQEFYFYRNVIQSQIFTEEFRQEVIRAKEESQLHFDKRNTEWIFGTYRDKTQFQAEIALNDKLLRKMLMDRQEEDLRFNYESLKKQIKIDKGFVELVPNESVLFNILEFVDLKESRKIIENLDFRIYPLNQNNVSPTEIKTIVNDNEPKQIDSSGNVMIQTKKNPLLEVNTKEVKFFENYFDTDKGQQLFNLHPHVPYVKQLKIDSNEQLAQSLLDKALEEQAEEEKNQINLDNGIDANNKQSSPVVYLNEDQGVNAKNAPVKKIQRQASIYKQSKILNKIQDEYQQQRAKDWIESKTMKYKCNGEVRKSNPKLPNYIKPTFPQAEFNEDYIYLEKLTERRVKTSSVANRIYFNAPTVEEIRKSGQHDFLLEAIENKRTPEEMMERLNLMITSELCDPLNKQLKIEPVALDFGIVCASKMYQMYFKLRNDDNMTNRVQIRHNIENNRIKIENFIGGKVVPGDTKKIKVVINTQDQIGKFSEVVEVQTKSFIYKIPIKALIVSEEEYDENQFKHEGRELYSKTYPVGDKKYKCDPIKVVLPKIKELEEIERKKNTEKQLNANNEDSDVFNNSDNQKLPQI